jgi:hypothetical protein
MNIQKFREGNFAIKEGKEVQLKKKPKKQKGYKPIKMTTDWFVKFGCKIQISFCETWGNDVFEFKKQPPEFGDNFRYDGENYWYEFNYVHEVQNLHYYLCGKELKISK